MLFDARVRKLHDAAVLRELDAVGHEVAQHDAHQRLVAERGDLADGIGDGNALGLAHVRERLEA